MDATKVVEGEVERQRVGQALASMQQEGAVENLRGRLPVLDRDKLKETACECYGRLRAEYDKLVADKPSSECDD